MKIIRIAKSNDCGGFRPPKGHLDTQMFPECEGYPTDRDIAKKNRKRKKKASIQLEAKLSFPIITRDANGIWEKWKTGEMSDEEFVIRMRQVRDAHFPGIDNEIIREGISNALDAYEQTHDLKAIAHELNVLLSEDSILDFSKNDIDREDVL